MFASYGSVLFFMLGQYPVYLLLFAKSLSQQVMTFLNLLCVDLSAPFLSIVGWQILLTPANKLVNLPSFACIGLIPLGQAASTLLISQGDCVA